MSNKVVLYIAMSLDGYIARKDGSVDWLFDVEGDGGDNGYAAFYQTIGTVVMGRTTYEDVLKLSEDFPYADRPTYVLSRSEQPPAPHVQFTTEPVESLIPRLQQASDADLWIVGGGQLVQAVMEKRLLHEMEVAIIPKILGEGIPLFPEGIVPSNLKMMGTQTLGQIVSIRYQVQI
ncbi:dihydrofolate reductase family protein [Paenibacillus illinoisensis]|uniref:dihydrofolate reductase family protein n=1 Tax=Paenibacillus illinoisensis TaxID=59845 RepID=UPI001C8EC013|nr:dihydrofolate reductase family protein [Paenibacillus illinoisensis]MBY0217700.1 dihydrofolate reductase [Paenibacillus illinoisensis]MCM3206594.1 dihydrofolate reductase family protein [Paenibacillus illinoisensis]